MPPNKLDTQKLNYLSNLDRKCAEELGVQVFPPTQSLALSCKGFAYPENSSQYYICVRKASENHGFHFLQNDELKMSSNSIPMGRRQKAKLIFPLTRWVNYSNLSQDSFTALRFNEVFWWLSPNVSSPFQSCMTLLKHQSHEHPWGFFNPIVF